MDFIDKIWKYIDKGMEYLMAVCFGGMTLVIFLQVVFRYCLKSPLSWSEELARYLFVYISFIGSVIAARGGQHIGVEVLVKRLPKGLEKVVTAIANLLTGIFFVIITVAFVRMFPMLTKQTTSALGISMAIPYLGLGLGAILMAVFYIIEAIRPFVVKES